MSKLGDLKHFIMPVVYDKMFIIMFGYKLLKF